MEALQDGLTCFSAKKLVIPHDDYHGALVMSSEVMWLEVYAKEMKHEMFSLYSD